MKAFISYSHEDANYLEKLKVHLAQIKRDGLITEWTDQEITAGSHLGNSISSAMSTSQLFISIVSPDYIASHYCYEKEFTTALQLQEEGKITIVPIIVEPCDWQSTPMGAIKALPDDGKPVSEWTNSNNAFAKVVQEIRKLLSSNLVKPVSKIGNLNQENVPFRNYRVKKIFTEVDKLDFKEKSFENIKDYFRSAIAEFNGIENLQARFLDEQKNRFTCLISNKGNLENAYINVFISTGEGFQYGGDLNYSFTQGIRQNAINMDKSFSIGNDDYNLYWEARSIMYSRREEVITDKQLAEKIWNEFIEEVGVS